MSRTIDHAPFIDIFDPRFQTEPAAVIDEIRGQSWLARTAVGVMAVGRPQVLALLADRRLRSALPEILQLQGVTDGPAAEGIGRSLLASEGEDHIRIRRLASRAFTPRSVDRHRPRMRAIMRDLVDALSSGRCEFMAEVADQYPIQVICHVLGVPEADHPEFCRWNTAITWALSVDLAAHQPEVEWGLAQLGAYVADLVVDRRRHPRDDMVSELVQAEEADQRLSDDEVRTLIASLLFAGHDTTRNQLGLAVRLFAEHPDQWRLLRQQPSLVLTAVEEVLRFQPPVSVTPRLATEDVDVDGYHIPAGTLVAVALSAANRDVDVYANPSVFDITAARQPVCSFGAGRHYCLGASLARAELQEALGVLATTMLAFELDGQPTWRGALGIFGPEVLRLRFASAG